MLSGEWNVRVRESVEKFRRVLGGGVGGWNKLPMDGGAEEAEALVHSREPPSLDRPSNLDSREAIRFTHNPSRLKPVQDPEASLDSAHPEPTMKMIDDEEPLISL